MQVLYYRRKIILALLEALGKDVSAKSLQKYLFLFTRRQVGEKAFDFVPYKYGCFSFQANQDLVVLSKQGYLDIEKTERKDSLYHSLHETHFIRDLDLFDTQAIREVCKLYGNMSQNELIAYTYRTNPFTAINSTIAQYLLTQEEMDKVRKYRERYKFTSSVLMTIGYEGFTLEKYLKQLICNDIRVLCDVRKNAFSMKYGFSKGILQKACEGVGIKYIHVPALGIESENRKALNTQEDYDRLFEEYEQTSLKQNWDALLYVRSVLDE
ncbi:DUF488 family protein, partial [Prevotella disiens]